MSDEFEAIVIDNGSGLLKAGLCGEDAPRTIFPTAYGRLKDGEAQQAPVDPSSGTTSSTLAKRNPRENDHFIGNQCQEYREHIAITNPIDRGSIIDWDAMEKLWDYTFAQELQLSPEAANVPVLMMDSPGESKAAREKLAQIMFETFKVPGFYIMQQSVLSLFASGRTRGLVVESGHGVSHAVPVFEGYSLPHATLRLDVAGIDISHALRRAMAKRNHVFTSREDAIVQDIKEKHCYVECNDQMDLPADQAADFYGDKPYELPDGTIITIDADCRSSPAEYLFNPSLLSEEHAAHDSKGLHELVSQSIGMCDADLQRDLFDGVVVAGGTTMLPGFAHRLHAELQALHPSQAIRMAPNLHGRERGYNSQRKIAAWVGGSMFASLPTFSQILVTKQEWEEGHETVINRKCF